MLLRQEFRAHVAFAPGGSDDTGAGVGRRFLRAGRFRADEQGEGVEHSRQLRFEPIQQRARAVRAEHDLPMLTILAN